MSGALLGRLGGSLLSKSQRLLGANASCFDGSLVSSSGPNGLWNLMRALSTSPDPSLIRDFAIIGKSAGLVSVCNTPIFQKGQLTGFALHLSTYPPLMETLFSAEKVSGIPQEERYPDSWSKHGKHFRRQGNSMSKYRSSEPWH